VIELKSSTVTESESNTVEFIVTTVDDQEKNHTKSFILKAASEEGKIVWLQAIAQRADVKIVGKLSVLHGVHSHLFIICSSGPSS
jgi:hypothetical protein